MVYTIVAYLFNIKGQKQNKKGVSIPDIKLINVSESSNIIVVKQQITLLSHL